MDFKFLQNEQEDEFERVLRQQFPNEGLPNPIDLPDYMVDYDPAVHGPLTENDLRAFDVQFSEEQTEHNEVMEMLSRTHIPEGEVPQSETLRRYDPQQLSVDNRPAVFVSIFRNRDNISDEEYAHLLIQQRRNLMDLMWERGNIMHTIVSQDENGFTLRTEINF
jgi:hypothetical protein